MNTNFLVYYARLGDKIARQALLTQYKPYLFAHIRNYVNKYPYIFQKDETSNISLLVFQNALYNYEFDKAASFNTFLTLRLKFHFAAEIRKNFTNKSILSTFAISKDFNQEANTRIFKNIDSNSYEKHIDKEFLRYIYSFLSTQDQEVISLWIEEYKYKEIGKFLGKNAKWVDNKITTILKKLRKIFSNIVK